MGERERGAQGAPHDGAWGAGGGRPRPAAPGRPAKRDGKPDPTASVSRCAVRLGCQGRLRAPGRPLPTQGAALDSATGAPEGGGGPRAAPLPKPLLWRRAGGGLDPLHSTAHHHPTHVQSVGRPFPGGEWGWAGARVAGVAGAFPGGPARAREERARAVHAHEWAGPPPPRASHGRAATHTHPQEPHKDVDHTFGRGPPGLEPRRSVVSGIGRSRGPLFFLPRASRFPGESRRVCARKDGGHAASLQPDSLITSHSGRVGL